MKEENEKTQKEPLLEQKQDPENTEPDNQQKNDSENINTNQKTPSQIETPQDDESGEDSSKNINIPLKHKYSKDDVPPPLDKDEVVIECPPNERFTYDPYIESNIFNKFVFYWAFTILRMARKYTLKPTDLGRPAKRNDANYYSNHLNDIWENQGYKHIENHALFKTVGKANACSLILVIILSTVIAALDYYTVIITKQFIDFFNREEETDKSIFYLDLSLPAMGAIFLGCQILSMFLSLHQQMILNNFGNKAGYELNCFIYNKILTYAPSGFFQRANEGEIINFIQIDSNRLIFLVMMAPNFFVAPLKIIAYTYLLFDFFGLTFISGLSMLIIFMILNFFISKVFRRRQKRMMGKKDLCMKVTTETFENIKILKLYNWENEFKQKILNARSVEMDYTNKRYHMTNLNQTINWLCPTLISIVTIGVYQIFNDKFSISTMLIGLSIFSKLQQPIRSLPNLINSTLETTVSMKRIEDFIKQPDVKKELVHRGEYDPNGEFAIKIENGNFSWGVKQKKGPSRFDDPKKKKKDDEKEEEEKKNGEEKIMPSSERTTIQENETPNSTLEKDSDGNFIKDGCKIQIPVPEKVDFDVTLKNINFTVKPGELVAIVGEVGCGKSSLLQAILNSLILLNPNECDGIHINGRIGYSSQIPWIQNDTIRNNITFSKEFDEDKYNKTLELCQLNEDLETFPGKDLTEIGEKGVNLSGGQKVRVSLARTIYNEPDIYLFDDPISALDANVGKKIMKYCIARYLKGKTRIVVTHALSYLKYMDRIVYMKNGKIIWTGTYAEVEDQVFYAELAKTAGFRKMISADESSMEEKKEKIIRKKDDEKVVKIIQEEEQSRGGIKWSVYLDYCRYMGGICYIIMVFVVMAFWQLNKGGSDFWLAYWSEKDNQEKTEEDPKYKWIFFSVFSALGLISVLFMFFRVWMLTRGVIRLGRTVHRDMIEKLIKAPINLFHETIPRGQIYNRLSKDLDTMNFSIFALGDLLISLLSVIGAFILCGYYDPTSLLYMPVVFVFGYFITKFYLGGSRPMTRIASISRSPILNTVSETLPGNTTIRAFQADDFYKNKYYNRINMSLNVNLCVRGITIWFQEMFKYISIFYLLYLVLRTIIQQTEVTAQRCSIVFTYSVMLQEYLGNIFSRCADLENNMVSMERCVKYMHIVQEKPSKIPAIDDNLIEQKWPQNGDIKFENLSVRYRPTTDIVLKKLNFHILPGEKVGVCGRTGSGKSTICLCLFRILEPLEGTIYIDDVDITTIGLELLRKNITIIPQDPCLLEGTLKYNIDPFNLNPNEKIVEILKNIGFEYTEDDDKIMDKMISQGGSNLSVGQKQLVCIARALLRKTKIVVMDEATANIDMNTEQTIQKALNLVLEGSTVITVAHRIKTIIHYDKILVLDAGEVKEFDSPKNLLKNEASLFFELYSKSTL